MIDQDGTEGTDPPTEEAQTETGGAGLGGGNGGAGVTNPPEDEPIGYKRPPKKHQFRPGQSGNPRGRPRGAKGLRKILEHEFAQKLNVTEGSRRIKLSKLQLIVKRELEKAMGGNQRSIEHVISLNIQMFGLGDDGEAKERELTIGEQLYLETIMKRVGPSSDADAGHQPNLHVLSSEAANEEEGRDDADEA